MLHQQKSIPSKRYLDQTKRNQKKCLQKKNAHHMRLAKFRNTSSDPKLAAQSRNNSAPRKREKKQSSRN
jgi:hypothetical protein